MTIFIKRIEKDMKMKIVKIRIQKKERLIQALVKELGSSNNKEKRIRKVVNKYL